MKRKEAVHWFDPLLLKMRPFYLWVKAGVARLCWGAKPQDQYDAFLEEQRCYPDV